MTNRYIDLTGQIFGSWRVVHRDTTKHLTYTGQVDHRVRFMCVCKCGTVASVVSYNLRTGKSTQCRQCSTSKQKKAA